MTMGNLRILKTISFAAMACVVLASATVADAQYREDRWEFSLGTFYQLGTTIDGQEGTGLETGNDFGFSLGGGYNFTDRLATTFGFQWAGVGYDATALDEDLNPVDISGKYDSFTLSGNLVYYFSDGPLSPYVGAGIGWTFLDTNIPNGAPSTGCWWDPWYGWVCYTSYPTETRNSFSYQASLGVRWDFNYSTFARLAWTSQWQTWGNANGTPRFDVIALEIGWMF